MTIDIAKLKALAEAFPSDLDWDSNTEPFFNGPSGESLGGGSTGFYCVYGAPFKIEGDDYEYDGPTYVESCSADFAKFMTSAREGVLSTLAEIDQLKAKLAATDQRNAVLTEALEDLLKGSGASPGANKRYAKARAALKSIEAGASE